jgi:hypothetical protein
MSGEIFLTSVHRLEEVLACSQDRLSAVGFHFPLLVELCSDWKWKFV